MHERPSRPLALQLVFDRSKDKDPEHLFHFSLRICEVPCFRRGQDFDASVKDKECSQRRFELDNVNFYCVQED